MFKQTGMGLAAIFLLVQVAGGGGENEQKKFEGTWQIVKAVQQGREQPKAKEFQMVFKGNTFAIQGEGKDLVSGTFKLDPAKSPRQIDMKIEKSNREQDAGKTVPGIYKFDGNSLTWCSTEPGSETRPSEFTSSEGSEQMLVELKKEKK